MPQDVRLDESWKKALVEEFEKPYFAELSKFVKDEIASGQTIYPHPKNIFAALDETPFHEVKVIILGQDPYHGPGQAHGLSFSVLEGVRNPPSLMNMFKEIDQERRNGNLPPDKGGEKQEGNLGGGVTGGSVGSISGDLTRWARQGVLLLNTTLTVRAGQPMSHAGKGWEIFTDSIIKKLSDERDFLVFLLWGSHAQKKKSLIDTNKHTILESPHPSPLSAHRGFLGNNHFSKTNALLRERGLMEIIW